MSDKKNSLNDFLPQSPIKVDSNQHDHDDTKRFTHQSGAQSSHRVPNIFLMPGYSIELTAERFEYGNHKYEDDNTVYEEANWLKAFHAKDVGFFRDRAAHVRAHLFAEMRGHDDPKPGGNLGAIGWFLEVMAYVKQHDPHFYGAIQGKYRMNQAQGPIVIGSVSVSSGVVLPHCSFGIINCDVKGAHEHEFATLNRTF